MRTEKLAPDILKQHQAVRETVGFLDLKDRGKIEVTGPDRITFLHAMISNDVTELSELAGRYGTLLTDRGKLVADFFYYKLPETLLIDVSMTLLPVMQETLQKYIIMDEVELTDLSSQWGHFSLQGPRASELVDKLFETSVPDEHYHLKEVNWAGTVVWLIAKPDLFEMGCELIVHDPFRESLKAAVLEAGVGLGLAEISQETRNLLRLEAGIPWFGQDMDGDRYPMEARLESAISLTKGCYLGQEVVSKATHIGGVNKLLMGLKVDQPKVPARDASVFSNEGTPIGVITSAVFSPRFGHPIALAYLKSKFALPGEECRVETGDGESVAAEIVEKFV
ncbi:MAG: glycine cleavage T C-terminal barrel domain-containing protein [Acidobacteriota bacterium]